MLNMHAELQIFIRFFLYKINFWEEVSSFETISFLEIVTLERNCLTVVALINSGYVDPTAIVFYYLASTEKIMRKDGNVQELVNVIHVNRY